MQSGNIIIDLLQSPKQLACPHDKHITPIEPFAGSGDAYYHYRCEVCGYQWAMKKNEVTSEVTERNTILLKDGTEADITSCGFLDEQLWVLATANGVNWAIPQGWPNNASPICQELEPAGYAALVASFN